MEFEKIRDIIVDQMGISKNSISMSTSFTNDLGADSLDILQIISEIEEEYDLEFTNEAAAKIKTVGDAVNYIKSMAK